MPPTASPATAEPSDLKRLVNAATSLVRPVRNLDAYRTRQAVDLLSLDNELQPPELSVLERLKPWLPGTTMLDIGVGGGRTTCSFSPLVRSYLGIDYSAPMIDACRARFPELAATSFATMDARDMTNLRDASFDFVLFSYNGIDTVSHEERLGVLAAMTRVVKPDGYVCLSSHNLLGLPLLYRIEEEARAQPYRWVRALVAQLILRLVNPPRRTTLGAPYALVRDGALEFRLRHYHVRPDVALDQLREAGLVDIEVFGLDGSAVEPPDLAGRSDAWLYYLARRPQAPEH